MNGCWVAWSATGLALIDCERSLRTNAGRKEVTTKMKWMTSSAATAVAVAHDWPPVQARSRRRQRPPPANWQAKPAQERARPVAGPTGGSRFDDPLLAESDWRGAGRQPRRAAGAGTSGAGARAGGSLGQQRRRSTAATLQPTQQAGATGRPVLADPEPRGARCTLGNRSVRSRPPAGCGARRLAPRPASFDAAGCAHQPGRRGGAKLSRLACVRVAGAHRWSGCRCNGQAGEPCLPSVCAWALKRPATTPCCRQRPPMDRIAGWRQQAECQVLVKQLVALGLGDEAALRARLAERRRAKLPEPGRFALERRAGADTEPAPRSGCCRRAIACGLGRGRRSASRALSATHTELVQHLAWRAARWRRQQRGQRLVHRPGA